MRIRLRPIVHASPTDDGIHLRGWKSSFTLRGGKGLWTLWQRLSVSLAEGIPHSEFRVPDSVSPAVAKALSMLIEQLTEHDMVVAVPDEWIPDTPPEDVTSWLESVAPQPQDAWLRLRAATFTITGTTTLATAAHRAFQSTGLGADITPGEGLVIVGGDHTVAGDCTTVGFVVHPGSYEDVITDAKAVALRLGLNDEDPPEILATLIGSAAAHRLICAVGGLPDPATEFIVHPGEEPNPPRLGVLVARMDPLRATYHPWLSQTRPQEPDLEALVDVELGPLPTPETGSLPQIPAKIALCGDRLGIGTTLDAARLNAANVPLDETHAHGIALRATVKHELADLAAEDVSEEDWACDPTARRWWKALTLRFAVPAVVEVTRLGDGVVHAEIRAGERVLAWAIEAEPADAVAFAALAATGVEQAREAGVDVPDEPFHLNGAAPHPAPPNVEWLTRDWHWPADVRDREHDLQVALTNLLDHS